MKGGGRRQIALRIVAPPVRKSHGGSVGASEAHVIAGRTGESFHNRQDPRTTDNRQNKCPDDAEEDRWQRHEGECEGQTSWDGLPVMDTE